MTKKNYLIHKAWKEHDYVRKVRRPGYMRYVYPGQKLRDGSGSSGDYKVEKSEDSDDNILTKTNKDGSQTSIYKGEDGNYYKNTYHMNDHSKDTSEKISASSAEGKLIAKALSSESYSNAKTYTSKGKAIVNNLLHK